MTIDEAKVLLCQMYLPQFDEEEKQALTMAIEALEELKAYHEIGTVEECKDAVENIEKFYQLGYNKAIDEVIMQLDTEVESSAKFIREYDDSIAQKAYYSGLCHAKKIAEQLKAGGIDGNERTNN